jgi:hypothetical protein
MTPAGLPHSDTPGSQLGCQLPRAYRRLQRPSSALDAKASTMCPSQLVSQTLNKNHTRHTPHHQHQPPTHTDQPHGPTATTGSGVPTKDQTTTPHHPNFGRADLVARCSRPLSTSQTPHPPTPPAGTAGRRRRGHRTTQPTPDSGPNHSPGLTGLIPQGPTACQTSTHRRRPQVPHQQAGRTEGPTPRGGWFVDDSTSEHHQCQPHRRWLRGARAP